MADRDFELKQVHLRNKYRPVVRGQSVIHSFEAASIVFSSCYVPLDLVNA